MIARGQLGMLAASIAVYGLKSDLIGGEYIQCLDLMGDLMDVLRAEIPMVMREGVAEPHTLLVEDGKF